MIHFSELDKNAAAAVSASVADETQLAEAVEFDAALYALSGEPAALIDESASLSWADCLEIYDTLYCEKYEGAKLKTLSVISDKSRKASIYDFLQLMLPLVSDEPELVSDAYITNVYKDAPRYNTASIFYKTGIFTGGDYGKFDGDAPLSASVAGEIVEKLRNPALREVYEPKHKQNFSSLSVDCIKQNPELPTGCEITSLAIVLNYLGFDADKCRLADEYLVKSEPGKATFNDAFIGNPYSSGGFGCFSPVIEKAANEYLKSQGSDFCAHNISGTDFEKLFIEIEQGNPVIVWATMSLVDETWVRCWSIDGEDVYFPVCEHCVVLCGFDIENGTVFVSDPLKGNVSYNLNRFKDKYNSLNRQAVVIK